MSKVTSKKWTPANRCVTKKFFNHRKVVKLSFMYFLNLLKSRPEQNMLHYIVVHSTLKADIRRS